MDNYNALRTHYNSNRETLNETYKLDKSELFKKLKIEHNDWSDDDVKFNIFYLLLHMMLSLSENNKEHHNFDFSSDAHFGLDELL
jgi:hypothetical protein